jgi:membrane protein
MDRKEYEGYTLMWIWTLLKETYLAWSEDNASRLAASLSYYTAISIAPLLIVIIAIAGLFAGTQQAQTQLVGQIQGLVGAEGAKVVQTVIDNADRPSVASVAGLISLVMLLWGASNVFAELQASLNRIWGVETQHGQGVLVTLKDRFFSFAMVVVMGFLLLVSLVVSAVLSALGNYLSGLLPGGDLLWQVLNFLISFAVITLLFGLMFKVLPDAKSAWRDIWLGAAVTALFFVIGKSLIGLYLGTQSLGSAYGAAGSLVVLLLWVYYSAQIFFFGAEFTQVYASRYGQGVRPAAEAVAAEESRAIRSGRNRGQYQTKTERG